MMCERLLGRRAGWLAASLILVVVMLPASPAAAAVPSGPAVEVRLVDLLNGARRDAGEAPVTIEMQLSRLAREHSRWMASRADDGGGCGDGGTLQHRDRVSEGVTAPWVTLLENVGCVRPGTADRMHEALMESEDHRHNLLADDVEHVGIGAAFDEEGTLWVTQIFMEGGVVPGPDVVRAGVSAARRLARETTPEFAVVARSDTFADSLAGAALAAGRAPVMFTPPPTAVEPDPVLHPRTRAELDRVLEPGSTVYLLGGEAAVSSRSASELRRAGYDVRRLAGTTRTQTAVRIAEEAVARHGEPDRVAVANAWTWPDAVTGSAFLGSDGDPVLLTRRDRLPEEVTGFLAAHPASTTVLGGTAAVTEEVRRQLGARRIAGRDRFETTVEIAEKLGSRPVDRVVVADGIQPSGWGHALAWASYAAATDSPELLVAEPLPAVVRDWVDRRDPEIYVYAENVTERTRRELDG